MKYLYILSNNLFIFTINHIILNDMTKEQQTARENRICELLHSLDDCVTYPVFCFMIEELIVLLQQVKEKRKEYHNILPAQNLN